MLLFFKKFIANVLCDTNIFINAGECNLTYISQPVRAIPCNVYTHTRALYLECNAYSNGSIRSDEFVILWYRNLTLADNSTNRFEPLQGTSRASIRKQSFIGLSFQRSRLTLRRPTINDMGEYWCQIAFMENGTIIEQLEPSQKALLLHPDAYSNLLPCPVAWLQDFTSKCAEDIALTPPRFVDTNITNMTIPTSDEDTLSSTLPWTFGLIGIILFLTLLLCLVICGFTVWTLMKAYKKKTHKRNNVLPGILGVYQIY